MSKYLDRLYTFIYGWVWLIMLSPVMVYLLLCTLLTDPIYPSSLEIVGILAGSYFYYEVIWVPVRKIFKERDYEFRKKMNW